MVVTGPSQECIVATIDSKSEAELGFKVGQEDHGSGSACVPRVPVTSLARFLLSPLCWVGEVLAPSSPNGPNAGPSPPPTPAEVSEEELRAEILKN